MPIQKLIDDKLLADQQKQLTREKSGLWTPSRFGKCYRSQFWSRKKEVETNAPDITALKRFKVGNLFHDYIQSFYPDAQIEVEVKDNDIIGYADVVLNDTVIDIKSVTEYAFKWFFSPSFDVNVEKDTNCLQVCTYAMLLNKPRANLIFVNIASVSTMEFALNVDLWKPKIEAELKMLRDIWDKQELPAAQPRCYIDKKTKKSKECGYCPFLDKCTKQEEELWNGKKQETTNQNI